MLEQVVQQLGRLPEAIFTASYTLLEGVLRYLTEHKQMNKLVTKELHLATFDDHHLLDALPFHIHSIKQDHQRLATETFRMLNEKLQDQEVESVSLDCEIIWRG